MKWTDSIKEWINVKWNKKNFFGVKIVNKTVVIFLHFLLLTSNTKIQKYKIQQQTNKQKKNTNYRTYKINNGKAWASW